MKVVDDLAQPLELGNLPRRIVCLVPSITETLFALGAGDRVAGITDFCIHPAGAVTGLPRVGGTKNLDVEKVFSLRPDLVIANVEENRKHHVETLRSGGIPVFVTFPKDLEGCGKTIRDIGALTGTERAAKGILEAIERARAHARAMARDPAPRVLCPIWKNPYMTVNRDTFVDSVIRESGGRNVFAGRDERYPQFTLQEVVEACPDVILLPTEPYRFREEDKADFDALGDAVPAVREHRIHIVEGELLSWYGPRVAQALLLLAGLFQY